MNRHSQQREVGSISLAGLASVLIGVGLVLVFSNYLRYVSAENALEEALQKTIRCINPSDAACVEYSSSAGVDLYDWYSQPLGKQTNSWTDRYRYQASVIRRDYELSFATYLIHKVPLPKVSYSEWEVPHYSFRPQFSEFAHKRLSLAAKVESPWRAEQWAPAREPNFPAYNAAYENASNSRSPAEWKPQKLNPAAPGKTSDAELPFQILEFPPKQISSEGEAHNIASFSSPFVQVPEYALPASGATCQDSKSQPCSISSLAGGSGEEPWSTHVRLAIKAFSEAEQIGEGANTLLRWAGKEPSPGSPDGYGLELQIISKENFQKWKDGGAQGEPSGLQTVCLGGASEKKLPTRGLRYANLDLRGVIRDVGKRDPACPNGNTDFSNLLIKRGDAFRINAYLKVLSGAAKVKVSLKYYFDEYVKKAEAYRDTFSCEKSILIQPEEESRLGKCPAERVCPELFKELGSGISACESKLETEDLCISEEEARSDAYAFKLQRVDCNDKVESNVCEANWKPQQTPNCISKRKFCEWRGEKTGTKTFRTQPETCPLAAKLTREMPCEAGSRDVTFRQDGVYFNPSDCPTVKALAYVPADLRQQAAEEYSPERWLPSLCPLDEEGKNIRNTPALSESQSRLAIAEKIYKTTSGVEARPSLSSFNISAAQQAALASCGDYTIQPKGEVEEKISSTYPFTHDPEFEIAKSIPTEDSCAGEPKPLEERLRYYATKAMPLLSNPDIVLNTSAEFVDTVLSSSANSCGGQGSFNLLLPRCTSIAHSAEQTAPCASPIYLGRFSSGELPEVCKSQSAACYSVAVAEGQIEAQPEASIQLDLAKKAGYREIQRSLSGAAFDCEAVGCARITLSEPEGANTVVKAEYNMPLSFPLSSILQKDSLQIVRSREEAKELSLVGRFKQYSRD